MRDLRIIDRTELLETLYEERERIVDEAAAVAKRGLEDSGNMRDVGIEVLCLLREVWALDAMRDEIARDTKHSPSAEGES